MGKLLLIVLAATASFGLTSGLRYRRDKLDCERLQDAAGDLVEYLDKELPEFKDKVVQDAEMLIGDNLEKKEFWCRLADVRTLAEFTELIGQPEFDAYGGYAISRRIVRSISNNADIFISGAPADVKDLPKCVVKLVVVLNDIGVFSEDIIG